MPGVEEDLERELKLWHFVPLLIPLGLAGLVIWHNINSPWQVNFNEGWNAYHIQEVVDGASLYPPQWIWTVTNYPPGSFWAAGLLTKLGLSPVMAGRVLSLLGLALVSVAAYRLLRLRTAASRARFGAAFVATFFAVVFPTYVAMNDPQMLALGCGLLAFSFAVKPPLSWRDGCLVAALFVSAIGTKHNVVGLFGAAVLYLAIYHIRSFWRLVVPFCFLAVLCGGLGHLLYGESLWMHLLAKRSYSLTITKANIKDVLAAVSPVFVLGALYFGSLRGQRTVDPLLTGVLVSGSLALVFAGGSGVGSNMFFEAIFFCLLAALLACAQTLPDFASVAIPLLLFLNTMPQLAHGVKKFSPAGDVQEARSYRQQVEYLRQRPGPALCEHLLLCFHAGKTFEGDLYWTGESLKTGRLDVDTYVKKISSRHFQTIHLEIAPGEDPNRHFVHFRLPPEVVAALRSNYRLAHRNGLQTFWETLPARM